MRRFGRRVQGFAVAAVLVACSSVAAWGQAGPVGQPRSARGGNGCQEGTPGAANDPNCAEAAPGFAVPALETAVPDSPHAVTALVRVDAMMKRPPVALPNGNSFTLVGTATLIKVRRADQDACTIKANWWRWRSARLERRTVPWFWRQTLRGNKRPQDGPEWCGLDPCICR